MPPKKKKNPQEPLLIPEDVYLRARKLLELKSAPKAPKGSLTSEEWCISPALHGLPELKPVVHYWKQCAVVKYEEREAIKAPSMMKNIDSEEVVKKRWTRKEITELQKYLKSQTKQANKRSGQFLKQLEKKEKKETKRQTVLSSIATLSDNMTEELKSSHRFVDKQQLFDKRYMIGTKLGETAPRNNVLIVVEASERQALYVDETKDEVQKFLNTVISETGDTFNIATFSAAAVNTWCPTFQNKDDPKKGLAESLKWLNKAVNPKALTPQPFPPDYLGMLGKFTAEGVPLPHRIFLCVSGKPEDSGAGAALDFIKDLRATRRPPVKGGPVVPINVVAFNHELAREPDQLEFFTDLAGEHGKAMFDTSQEDLKALDMMLKSVATKTKQLAKLNKKLDKLEDLSEQCDGDRQLLQMQLALQKLLDSDYEVVNWALTVEQPAET